jgi:hypothetical protein
MGLRQSVWALAFPCLISCLDTLNEKIHADEAVEEHRATSRQILSGQSRNCPAAEAKNRRDVS